ncbi:MAG: hypothetical protein U1U88_001396 [Lawsonella clevelandensis]
MASTIGDIPDAAALAQSAIGQRNVALTPSRTPSSPPPSPTTVSA